MKPVVVVKKITNRKNKDDIRCAMFSIFNTLMPYIELQKNSIIVTKINLCLLIGPETGGTVDPFLVECLVDWLQVNYSPKIIYIAESDATHLDADMAFKILGWQDLFNNQENVKLLNLSKDELVEVRLNGKFFKSLQMSKTYMECDYLVSFAKLKVHEDTKISCILKNQFGSLPERLKIKYHPWIKEVIHDLNKVKMPDLCLVDGLVGMERKGPIRGMPKPLGLIIAGNNPVSTDIACSRTMGFPWRTVPHLNYCYKKGLGPAKFEIMGNNYIRNFRFRFVPWYTRLIKAGISFLTLKRKDG